MRALDRKLIRDLWHLRGQVLAIGLVIASGVAVLVMALSTQSALLQTVEAYYERYMFGHVFAELKRAPRYLADRIRNIPGVETVETRVVRLATVDLEGFAEPVMGQFVSIPVRHSPALNQLVIRAGRSVAPERPDEVVLNEPFAEAHALAIGDELVAILNGRRRPLRIVGIGLSPEFIYSLGPGALMPDDLRFGVMWMGRDALAGAFDLQSSFNSVSLRLARGVSADSIIPQVDQLLARYGGVGAIARADQLSNWFVMNEIDQLDTVSRILPAIFLIVTAFLTNMVLARLIATERTQIGLMKAFGYTNLEVGWHYTKLVMVIAVIGIALGFLAGAWVGRLNTEQYAALFRFPLLLYRPSPEAFAIAAGLNLGAALLGAFAAVRRAVGLQPAHAMIPPSPRTYRRSLLANTCVGRWLDQPTRIVLRHTVREPVRSLLTCGGVAFAVGLLVMTLQWNDALNYLAQSYFFDAQRQHVMLGLLEAEASDVVHEFERMPGVLSVEAMRSVRVDFHAGAVRHRGTLSGVPGEATLQPIFDDQRHAAIPVPAHGLVLATRLARKLGVGIGDHVWINVLEGRRPEVQMPVVELVETYIAMPAYVHLDGLDRLLQERPAVQHINLLVDPRQAPALYQVLKGLPDVSAVMLRQAAIDSFYDTVVEHLMVTITTFSLFALALGFGVTYNATRISLSERGRELATLRVLGFSRGEVSYILLGEVALLIVLGLPIGCLLGLGLATVMANAFDTELFRIPLVIAPSTYGTAVVIALVTTLGSAALVRRRVDRLNLIEVLKTRE